MTPEQEKYKLEQKNRMGSYTVGAKDNVGCTITKIFCRADEYFIYEIETTDLSDSIKVIIDTIIEENDIPIKNFSIVREKYIKLKGLLYKVVDNTSIKARISHILSHAISGYPAEANIQFESLINEIEKEYSSQYRHRINYLITTVGIMIISIIASFIVYYYALFTEKVILRDLIFTSTAGSLGGFISITRRLKQTIFDKDVKYYLYIFYAIERMLIAIVAGVTIYFAIKSNLIFGVVTKLEKPIFGYFIFSIVAGFSETLIPNMLITLEKKGK